MSSNENKLDIDNSYFIGKIGEILSERFKGSPQAKTKIKTYQDRVNFACPYCGDSHDHAAKKRGNMWYNTLYFECFNCSTRSNFERLCKDFEVKIDLDNKLKIISYLESIKTTISDYKDDFVSTSLKDVIILDEFIETVNTTITNFPIRNVSPIKEGSAQDLYLKERKIISEEQRKCIYQGVMYYTSTFYEPVILILNRNKTNLLGLQMRNLKSGTKRNFKVYSFEMLMQMVYPDRLDNLEARQIHLYNKLSYLYNVLNVNMESKITVFEGYLDSIFYPNSIGAIGVNSDIDFLIKSGLDIQFFYDNDNDGNKLSLTRLNEGYKVFLWNKLFEHIIKMKNPKDYYDYERRIKSVKDLNKLNELANDAFKTFELPKHFSVDNFDRKYIPIVKNNIYKKNNYTGYAKTNSGIHRGGFKTNRIV